MRDASKIIRDSSVGSLQRKELKLVNDVMER